MTAETVHVTQAFRNASIAHDDRDLMRRFRQQRPEVPVVVGAAHTSARIALDGVIEIGEAQRIVEEKHRRVVADDIPVAPFSIELQGKAADIALGVSSAALARDGRETGKHWCLLADLGENPGLGVTRDVVRDGEGHAALGDHFAGEMGELLDQPDILQQRGAALSSGLNVKVIRDGSAGCMG